jgi:hypothetical protein
MAMMETEDRMRELMEKLCECCNIAQELGFGDLFPIERQRELMQKMDALHKQQIEQLWAMIKKQPEQTQ